MLTLTGPGGIGKTRLALQVAAKLLDHFVDGIYLVALDAIRDPGLVGAAIAQTLGVHETAGRTPAASLPDYLRDRQLLLVLDNFEQVAAAAPLVADLLAQCSRLKVLATSRVRLHLYGEYEYAVPPLALPRLEAVTQTEASAASNLRTEIDVQAMAATAAVALFIERATAAGPDFVLSAANAPAVAAICVNLDGLPLAIELAAARLKLFSPAALLAQLQQRLALLKGGPQDAPARQRTLRDEIAWSYDLLAPAEQILFRRLAVFAGGFTLAAAQAVGDAAGDLGITVLDGTASLLDQNLLKRSDLDGGEPRFGMLETIREYGLEQLSAREEAETIRRHHTGYFLARAETLAAAGDGPHAVALLKGLSPEHANLRLALEWSYATATATDIVLRLVVALQDFWVVNGYWREGRRWMESVLSLTIPPELAALRARALVGAGCMATMLNDHPRAGERLAQGMALARELGLQRLVAQALTYLSFVANRYEHDQAKANRLLEQVFVIGQEIGDKNTMAESLLFRGGMATQVHDYPRAQALCEQSLALYREMGLTFGIADTLSFLGEIARLLGNYQQARMLYRDSLLGWQALGNFEWKGVVTCLSGLAGICVADQQFAAAAHLSGAAEIMGAVLTGSSLPPAAASAAARFATLRRQEDEAAFIAAWAEGRRLTPQEAVEYALALPDPPPASPAHVAPRPASTPAGMTTREIDVLRLLAQGLTYAAIAEQLVVSTRTVNGHVTSIYSKLGVTNRMAAIRFATDHSLI